MPSTLAGRIQDVARQVALAMKTTYQCDGILLRQHNEPAGGQRIFHYHLHIIPRYVDDGLFTSQKLPFPEKERASYAQRLRAAL